MEISSVALPPAEAEGATRRCHSNGLVTVDVAR
jgi:hypothetical protein